MSIVEHDYLRIFDKAGVVYIENCSFIYEAYK